MMFYNGFNLLIDIIVGAVVFYFTRRASWLEGYSAGQDDLQQYIDSKADYDYESYRDSFYDQEKDMS